MGLLAGATFADARYHGTAKGGFSPYLSPVQYYSRTHPVLFYVGTVTSVKQALVYFWPRVVFAGGEISSHQLRLWSNWELSL